jgi:hypothetical protein
MVIALSADGDLGDAERARAASAAHGGSGDDERRKRSFAYDETRRVLDRQATILSELRDRANIVLAADAVVATLFAGSVLGKGQGHSLALEILALTAFALGIVACVLVLLPAHDQTTRRYQRQWQVTFDLLDLVDFMEGADPESWQQWTAPNPAPGRFQLARNLNYNTNKRRSMYLVAASVLLVVQIALWAAVVLA